MRTIPRGLASAAVLFLLAAALGSCSDDDGDGVVTVILDAACTSTLGGSTSPRVFLDCATVSQNLVNVEIVAADIPDEIDGYNVHLSFSPSVFRYVGFDATAEPFAAGSCGDPNTLLCEDNADDANNTGLVIYSMALVGSDPPGEVIGQPEVLGRLLFEAASVSSTSVSFVGDAVTTAECVDQASGTALLTYDPLNASCPPGVETIGGLTLDSSSLTLSATNP